ncbi:MAG: nicotinate-nicotinamide nucleotide adenylyltransferase, partial [Burkholderiales bacterium]
VAQRPGTHLAAPHDLDDWLRAHGRGLVRLPFEPRDVSANEIRTRIARGESTDDLIPPLVAQYLIQHGLYRQHEA